MWTLNKNEIYSQRFDYDCVLPMLWTCTINGQSSDVVRKKGEKLKIMKMPPLSMKTYLHTTEMFHKLKRTQI